MTALIARAAIARFRRQIVHCHRVWWPPADPSPRRRWVTVAVRLIVPRAWPASALKSTVTMLRTRQSPPSSPPLQQQRLHRPPEGPALVRQPAHLQHRPILPHPAFGVGEDPLPLRLPRQADGEVGVDEGPGVSRELGGDAVGVITGGGAHGGAQPPASSSPSRLAHSSASLRAFSSQARWASATTAILSCWRSRHS
jgi:hypothetical protein